MGDCVSLFFKAEGVGSKTYSVRFEKLFSRSSKLDDNKFALLIFLYKICDTVNSKSAFDFDRCSKYLSLFRSEFSGIYSLVEDLSVQHLISWVSRDGEYAFEVVLSFAEKVFLNLADRYGIAHV